MISSNLFFSSSKAVKIPINSLNNVFIVFCEVVFMFICRPSIKWHPSHLPTSTRQRRRTSTISELLEYHWNKQKKNRTAILCSKWKFDSNDRKEFWCVGCRWTDEKHSCCFIIFEELLIAARQSKDHTLRLKAHTGCTANGNGCRHRRRQPITNNEMEENGNGR